MLSRMESQLSKDSGARQTRRRPNMNPSKLNLPHFSPNLNYLQKPPHNPSILLSSDAYLRI